MAQDDLEFLILLLPLFQVLELQACATIPSIVCGAGNKTQGFHAFWASFISTELHSPFLKF